jgi:hypothetical protein
LWAQFISHPIQSCGHRIRSYRRYWEDTYGQVSEGGGETGQGPRQLTGVLRLPGRTLAASAHDQPDRVDVCYRTTRTRNCVSRATFLGLAFKLIEEAEKSWRKIRGADKIEALLNGLPFKDGILVHDNPPEQQKLAA